MHVLAILLVVIGPFAGAMLGELTADANWASPGGPVSPRGSDFWSERWQKSSSRLAMVGIFLTAWFVS